MMVSATGIDPIRIHMTERAEAGLHSCLFRGLEDLNSPLVHCLVFLKTKENFSPVKL